MADMEVLGHKFDALRAEIKSGVQEMMDERGFGGSEYHTKKVLKAISESNSLMEYLVASTSSSNGTIVSDSEGEDTLPCSRLEDEEAVVLAVDEKEEEVIGDSRKYGPGVQVIVGKRRGERERDIVNKRYLTLGFHNGMLQVLPPLW